MMSHQSIQDRLGKKPSVIGVLQIYPSRTFAELAGLTGYDFVVLDLEHGLLTDVDVFHAVQATSALDIAVIVRPRDHDPRTLGRHLDFGVDGFLIPDVSTAGQAKALVEALHYPPHGTRGFAAPAHRSSRFGFALDAHKASPRGNAFLAVLIESARGVASVDAILAVDGIDAAIIGPADLSAHLGAVGDFSSPAFKAAFERLEGAASTHGKIAGAAPLPDQQLAALFRRGHRLFILGSDTSLMRGAMLSRIAEAEKTLKDAGNEHAR